MSSSELHFFVIVTSSIRVTPGERAIPSIYFASMYSTLGIDFLRNLYAQSGLSIQPKTKVSKIQQLKLIIEAWDMTPHEILSKQALTMPHRTVIDPEQTQIDILNHALKQAILLELKHT